MRTFLAALLFVSSLSAIAQEVEPEPEPEITTTSAVIARDTRLHTSPAGPATAALPAGESVTVVGLSRTGWLRIRSSKGKGWIDRHFVQAETAFSPRDFTLSTKGAMDTGDSASKACKGSLDQCPLNGCAEEGSSHALANTLKHGPGKGSVAQLPLTAFKTLQNQAENLVGEAADLDAEDRKLLRSLEAGGVTTGEGHLVSISGFLVGKPHPNSGESVNCKLTGSASNDFHISIASSADKSEFASVVIEMVPQDRNEAWTLTALNQVLKAKKRVVVVGQLFYDGVHRVNADESHPLGGQPKRFSLWEVHPVGKFFVCTQSGCNAKTLAGYTKLEDVEFPL